MSERKKGSTGVTLEFRLADATTGVAVSGVNVTTLKLQYKRPGEAPSTATSLTAKAAFTTAHAAYAAKEADATNSKGIYDVDCPDAAFAAGADEAALSISGTAVETSTRLIDLTAADMRDGVRLGLTALPNVASGSAGAVVTSGTGTAQLSLTAGVAAANATQVAGSAAAATNLSAQMLAQFPGVVSADATATATAFTANTTGSPGLSPIASKYVGAAVAFYGGAAAPLTRKVTAYSYSGGVGTFTIAPALDAAPATDGTAKFLILGYLP